MSTIHDIKHAYKFPSDNKSNSQKSYLKHLILTKYEIESSHRCWIWNHSFLKICQVYNNSFTQNGICKIMWEQIMILNMHTNFQMAIRIIVKKFIWNISIKQKIESEHRCWIWHHGFLKICHFHNNSFSWKWDF